MPACSPERLINIHCLTDFVPIESCMTDHGRTTRNKHAAERMGNENPERRSLVLLHRWCSPPVASAHSWSLSVQLITMAEFVGNLSMRTPGPTPGPSFRKAKSTPGPPAQTPAPEHEGSFLKSGTAGQPAPERDGSFRKSSTPGQTPNPVEREESFRSAKSSTPATPSRASAAKSYDTLLKSRSRSLTESSAKEKAGIRAPILMVDPPTEIFVCTVRVKLSESLDLTSQAKGFLNPGVRVAVRRRDEIPTRPPTRRILVAIPNAVTTLGWISATKDGIETLKEPPPEGPSPEKPSSNDGEEKGAASPSPDPPALAIEQKPQETVMPPQSPDTISAILTESPPAAGAWSILEKAGLPPTPTPSLDAQRSLAGETSAMVAASAGASSNRRRIQSADLSSVSQLSRRVLNRSNSSSFNNGSHSQSSSFNTGPRSRSQSSSFNSGSSRNQQESTRLQRSRSSGVLEAVL